MWANWIETWHLALESLRANKLRAALTMLGVIIGSACIVLVVTVALTGKRYINGEIEAIGSNVVHGSLAQGNTASTVTLADQISLGDMEAVREGIPQASRVAGTNDFSMTVLAAGKAIPVGMIGVTPEFEQIRRLIILPGGRYFDDDDFASVSKVCVISEHLSKTALAGDGVGQNLRIGEMNFTVIGIFRERQSTFGESEIRDDSVLVPFPLIRYFGEQSIVTLYAQADTTDDVPLVTDAMGQILKSRHRPEVSYDVGNLRSILDTANDISWAMTVVLLFVALLALVISGVGIMNIMLVSVTERTREIGIRKALGARRKEILWQFLLEAMLISGIGATIGVGIASAIPFAAQTAMQVFQVATDLEIPVSMWSVIAAFAVSCATGILFGYLPANKAALLQPVESLRQE